MIKEDRNILEGRNDALDIGEIVSLNRQPIQAGCPSCASSKKVPISYNIELRTRPEVLRNVPIGNFSEGDDSEVYPVRTLVLIGYIKSGEPVVLKRLSSMIISDYTHNRNVSLREGEKIVATKHGNYIRFLDDGRIVLGGTTRDTMTKEEVNSSLTLGGNQGRDLITYSDYVIGLRTKGSFLGFDKLGNFFLKVLNGIILSRNLKLSTLDKMEFIVKSAFGRLNVDIGSNILIKSGQNIHAFVGTSEEDYPDEKVTTYLNSTGVTYLKGERLVIDLTGSDDVVKEIEIIAHEKDASIKIEKGNMSIDVDTGKMDITVNGDVHITTNGKARIEANGNVELKGANVINQDGTQFVLTNKVICPVTGNAHIHNQFTVKAP